MPVTKHMSRGYNVPLCNFLRECSVSILWGPSTRLDFTHFFSTLWTSMRRPECLSFPLELGEYHFGGENSEYVKQTISFLCNWPSPTRTKEKYSHACPAQLINIGVQWQSWCCWFLSDNLVLNWYLKKVLFGGQTSFFLTLIKSLKSLGFSLPKNGPRADAASQGGSVCMTTSASSVRCFHLSNLLEFWPSLNTNNIKQVDFKGPWWICGS